MNILLILLLICLALLMIGCAPTQNCAVQASRVYAFLDQVDSKRVRVISRPGQMLHVVTEWRVDGTSFRYDPKTDRAFITSPR